MDSCLSVEKELEKLLQKFSGIKDHSEKVLDGLIENVESLRQEFNDAPADHNITPGQSVILSQTMKKMRDAITLLAGDHKDVHSSVSRVGKQIDRNFISDFGATSCENYFEESNRAKQLNQVICEHFYRQGLLDVGEELVKESGLEIGTEKKEPFTEMNKNLEALKNGDLEPALEWAQANRDRLRHQNSSLEFKLHKLQFIEMLKNDRYNPLQAINYARVNFPRFADQHEKEIQTLMGCLLYLNQDGLENSPYKFLLDRLQWADVCDIYTRDACSLLGLSVESPLAICINIGCTALPALLNIRQVMTTRQVHGVWTSREELPIEVDIGNDHHYHSVFACPILKQQSTDSNPPMRLVCGHVVSKDALHKLAQGGKLKCPYCPVEQSPLDAKIINF